METSTRVFVAGHRGMVGSALLRALVRAGHDRVIVRTRDELDLGDQAAVRTFFREERPQVVLLAAARVGGIQANSSFPADFIAANLAIQTNVIQAAHDFQVRKLVFLGSSCIYPKEAAQPIREEALLTGPLEPTSEPYAVAKIAGIRMCQAFARQHGDRFICLMPATLYGPHDNFDPEGSHVLPALIRKFDAAAREHERTGSAPTVELWGSGSPRREFMFVDDFAEACLFLLERYDEPELLNVGVGEDISIRDLAGMVAKVTGFRGEIRWDRTRSDGTLRKLLNIDRLRSLGWQASTSFEEGLERTYDWYRAHVTGRPTGLPA